MRKHCFFLWVILFFAIPASADVFKPAYLQVNQTSVETYDLMWKIPAVESITTLSVAPVFPEGTEDIGSRSNILAAGASVQRWSIRVPGGLEDKPIEFTNLSGTGLDVLVRVERMDGTAQLERILPIDPHFTLTASPGPLEVVATYTVLGVEHILTGFDHLLFVLALMMIVTGTKRLLFTITAFTVAHSITLAIAALGIIHVPGPPVEAIIALSIVFVASEILNLYHGREGLAVRKPWLVAFSFGLLHGLGFAGALAEIGLPENAIPLSLLFFNIGVEIGQLVFVAVVLIVISLARRLLGNSMLPRWAAVTPAYIIGGIASFWLVERTVAFWS